LPSIAVTIGTLTMFRGLAEVVLGQSEPTGFPTSLTNIGIEPIFLHIAYPFFFFVVLAVIYGVVVHKTAFGRALFAIGLNTEAAFFSGIRVKRTKFLPPPGSSTRCSRRQRSTPQAPGSSSTWWRLCCSAESRSSVAAGPCSESSFQP
jgi:hypothetical protein